jgi:hypothetical protein
MCAMLVGWLLKVLRERDEKDNEWLKSFRTIDKNLKTYADEQREEKNRRDPAGDA